MAASAEATSGLLVRWMWPGSFWCYRSGGPVRVPLLAAWRSTPTASSA